MVFNGSGGSASLPAAGVRPRGASQGAGHQVDVHVGEGGGSSQREPAAGGAASGSSNAGGSSRSTGEGKGVGASVSASAGSWSRVAAAGVGKSTSGGSGVGGGAVTATAAPSRSRPSSRAASPEGARPAVTATVTASVRDASPTTHPGALVPSCWPEDVQRLHSGEWVAVYEGVEPCAVLFGLVGAGRPVRHVTLDSRRPPPPLPDSMCFPWLDQICVDGVAKPDALLTCLCAVVHSNAAGPRSML